MISATKGPTPPCLTTLATTPGANWDQSVYGAQRKEIREALSRDQGTLCAYCQRRARPSDAEMRIDHWHPRTDGGEHFQWSNLVGSCAHRESCDDRKGDAHLFLHPYRGHGGDPRQHLCYTGAGLVRSDDPRAEADLAALNLNHAVLQRGRREAIAALTRTLQRSEFSVHALRQRLRACESPTGGEAPEYAAVLTYTLARWLRKRDV